MKRLLLMAVVWATLSWPVFGQEVAPFIVEGPQISRTAFVNWENIELIYTVRYLQSYQPVWSGLQPRQMVFSVMELDPQWADRLDVRNQRSLGKESYFDVVYHLRHLGEKKGEIDIPAQKFPYFRLQAGKEEGELAVQYFEVPGFKLVYHSVLTSDADDIKDVTDLGSFSLLAARWRLAALMALLTGLVLGLALIFRKPALAITVETAEKEDDLLKKEINPARLSRSLEMALAELKPLLVDSTGNSRARVQLTGAVCNDLRKILQIYLPAIGSGMTNQEMKPLVEKIKPVWQSQRLAELVSARQILEDFLYTAEQADHQLSIEPLALSVERAGVAVKELRSWEAYWRQWWFRWEQKIIRPFLRLKWWRPW